MSSSEQQVPLSPQKSAKHRRVSALASPKRGRSAAEDSLEPSTEGPGSSRAYAATNPRFKICLEDCDLDPHGSEKPYQEDLDALKEMMTKARSSPEPGGQEFHETRNLVVADAKNETSVAKR